MLSCPREGRALIELPDVVHEVARLPIEGVASCWKESHRSNRRVFPPVLLNSLFPRPHDDVVNDALRVRCRSLVIRICVIGGLSLCGHEARSVDFAYLMLR